MFDTALDLFNEAPAGDDARALAVEQLHRATALYTRSHVVDALLNDAGWPQAGKRLCDPAAGDGAFLDAALRRLLDRNAGADAGQILDSLEGWEIHAGACRDARERLTATLCEHGWDLTDAQRLARQIVHQGDFLTDVARAPRYDVIAANPPYLRYTKVPSVLQALYDVAVPEFARADLLNAFLERCRDMLRPGGTFAAVTSDRWCFNAGAANLRAVLGQTLRVKQLTRIDGDNAFYRPKDRRAGTPPRVHPVTVILERADEAGIVKLDGAPIYPGAPDVRCTGRTLSDIATVRLAPWLGTPGIFVVKPDVAATLPSDWLIPVADGKDFTGGVFSGPKAFAIRTEAAETPEALPGPIIDHLRRELPRMCRRGRRDKFWLPPETWLHRFDLSRPSIIVPRICRGLTAVELPPGILPIDHGLSIAQSGGASLEQVAEALRAPLARQWIEARAPRLEGGFVSVTTLLLRTLPVSIDRQIPCGAAS